MHGPNGSHHANESVFVDIEAARKIVLDHLSLPRFRLTVEFSSCAGGTLVNWVQAFEDPVVAEAIRHIVEPANEQNLTRLAAELATVDSP